MALLQIQRTHVADAKFFMQQWACGPVGGRLRLETRATCEGSFTGSGPRAFFGSHWFADNLLLVAQQCSFRVHPRPDVKFAVGGGGSKVDGQ